MPELTVRTHTLSELTADRTSVVSMKQAASSSTDRQDLDLRSYRVKQWWQTSLDSFLDTQLASGSAEYTSSPLLILAVARTPLPFPGLTNRCSFGAIVGFLPPREPNDVYIRNRRTGSVMTSHTRLHMMNSRFSCLPFLLSILLILPKSIEA